MARLLAVITLALAASLLAAADGGESTLRGYREVRWAAPAPGTAVVHRFTLSTPELAARFASKVLSDFAQTPGNLVRASAQGDCDLVDLGGTGVVVPLAVAGSSEVLVAVAPSEAALRALALPAKRWLRRAELRHPDWLDKWDRHCLGMWQYIGDYAQDSRNKTLDSFYEWFGKAGLLVQINRGNTSVDQTVNSNQNDYLRAFFTRYGVRYQQVEWLSNEYDLYNRNAFLTTVPNPAVATRSHYYGERFLLGNPLRQLQNASAARWLRPTISDPNQMSLLDPDGEIGPFDFDRWGLNGPMAQREFTRFLREVRGLDLAAVAQRHRGRADAFRSWADVPLADWREFYGFTAGSLDLAGEWRFQRDDDRLGLIQAWAAPATDDSGWARLHYPGDALVFGLPRDGSPLWMRRTITVPAGRFAARTLLTVAVLGKKPAQVFVNGALAGAIAPRVHTASTIGQFDVTAAIGPDRRLTVALRLAGNDTPIGPVFLSDRPMEDFPTADVQLNARRFDHLEFTDWAIAQAMGGTLATLRSLDPDRPIKVHAYDGSPWGLQMMARYGAYSHHTGSGAGWTWSEPKQYGASRGLQDSSEPGGPMANLRDLKGLWGNLIAMGKNAHDYFMNFQCITRDPAMRAWFEAKLPAIRVMGRVNPVISPVAAMRSPINGLYTGEFARWETWRYGAVAERGGELVPLLDEVRIRDGGLQDYRVIIDEGTGGWDAAMSASLRAYVEAGGILVLNAQSGRHDFLHREVHPGEDLAGSAIGAPIPQKAGNVVTFSDPGLPGLPATAKAWERDGEVLRQVVPGAGATVAATWSDGSPALVRRSLGKGAIWLCGAGTYPKEFTLALAAQHGPQVWATATGADLLRISRSNNGGEDLVMVRGVGGKPVTVTWHLDFAPSAVFDPATGAPVPATITGNTVEITTALDDWDFTWFAVRRPDPDAQLRHWFHRQGEMWGGTAAGVKPVEPALFRRLDLNRGWKLARTASLDEATALIAGDGSQLKPTPLILWDAPGFAEGGPCGLYRNDFTLPSGWETDTTLHLSLRGQVHDSRLHGFTGSNRILLNGAEVWKGDKADSLRLDVTRLVKAGANRLEIVHQGPGVMLGITLVRSLEPDTAIDLAGPWRSVEGLNSETERILPGPVTAAFVYRDVTIPAGQRGQEVWLQVDGSFSCAIINGRLRYWDVGRTAHLAPEPGLAIDITPDIRWGALNRIVLCSGRSMQGWSSSELACSRLRLGFYAPGRWSGTPIRDALTAREQAGVARDLGSIGQYPLIHAQAARPAIAEQVAAGFAAPAPAFDLAFGSDGISDVGPAKAVITLHGATGLFSEAGGRIRGAFLHADGQRNSAIILPQPLLKQIFAKGTVTMRTWVKPLANDRSGGSLFNWGSWYLGLGLDGDACAVTGMNGRIDGEAMISQRRWQSLTVVLDGTSAALYTDGMPAAQATLRAPYTGVDAPAAIGAVELKRDFLNARLAAFSLYDRALTAHEVKQLYLGERARFIAVPGDPADDLFRLDLGGAAPVDASDIPGQLKLGVGATIAEEGGRRHLALDGKESFLLPQDHGRSKLLVRPFTLAADLRPDAAANAVIFRRHHLICLFIDRNGDLVLDANIGRNNQCRFSGVITPAAWNRIVLGYDGRTVSLSVNGQATVKRDYPSAGFPGNSDYPTVFLADNTLVDRFPRGTANFAGQVRELRILPGILEQVPTP